jgi:hypothetical protein
MWLLFHALLMGHVFLCFLTRCHTQVCQLVWTAWSRMFEFQVTNKQTGPDPLLLEPKDCTKNTTHSDTLSRFLQLQSWHCMGMFCKRVIVCVSYMRMHFLMSLKQSSITPEEMRKLLELIILMGQVREETDYWSTDPTISTPIFPNTICTKHFESIWQNWHFSDNSQQTQ